MYLKLCRTSAFKVNWHLIARRVVSDLPAVGMVHTSPDSEYMKLLEPFLARKKQFALDGWGCDSKRVASTFQPVEEWMLNAVSGGVNIKFPKG